MVRSSLIRATERAFQFLRLQLVILREALYEAKSLLLPVFEGTLSFLLLFERLQVDVRKYKAFLLEEYQIFQQHIPLRIRLGISKHIFYSFLPIGFPIMEEK